MHKQFKELCHLEHLWDNPFIPKYLWKYYKDASEVFARLVVDNPISRSATSFESRTVPTADPHSPTDHIPLNMEDSIPSDIPTGLTNAEMPEVVGDVPESQNVTDSDEAEGSEDVVTLPSSPSTDLAMVSTTAPFSTPIDTHMNAFTKQITDYSGATHSSNAPSSSTTDIPAVNTTSTSFFSHAYRKPFALESKHVPLEGIPLQWLESCAHFGPLDH